MIGWKLAADCRGCESHSGQSAALAIMIVTTIQVTLSFQDGIDNGIDIGDVDFTVTIHVTHGRIVS